MDETPAPPTGLDGLLSARVRRLRSSAIRDLLHLTLRPSVISLAGGLPDPASFPVEELRGAAGRIDADLLQYSTTEGAPALREWIAARAGAARGRPVAPDQVLLTAGSQQALDLLGKALIDEGDAVAVEDPSYLGMLQAFEVYGPRFLAVPGDEDGMIVDALEARLDAGARVKLVYVVTNFGNPTGATLSLERRRQLARLADTHGFAVVEDDPYGALRFGDEPAPPPVAAFTDRAVTLGSFSKTVVPGLRLGWAVAPAGLTAVLARAKQGADLHSSTLAQHLIADLVLQEGWLDAHVRTVAKRYGERADVLHDALVDHLGDRAVHTRPQGGLFTWVRLTDHDVDTSALLGVALDRGVAFVPGAEFSPDPSSRSHDHALRLSFATAPLDQLPVAVERLAAALPG